MQQNFFTIASFQCKGQCLLWNHTMAFHNQHSQLFGSSSPDLLQLLYLGADNARRFCPSQEDDRTYQHQLFSHHQFVFTKLATRLIYDNNKYVYLFQDVKWLEHDGSKLLQTFYFMENMPMRFMYRFSHLSSQEEYCSWKQTKSFV